MKSIHFWVLMFISLHEYVIVGWWGPSGNFEFVLFLECVFKAWWARRTYTLGSMEALVPPTFQIPVKGGCKHKRTRVNH